MAVTDLRTWRDGATTEKEFQQAIVNLARVTGWALYHTYRSDRSPAGFPDLILCKPPRIVAWECKREGGKPTQEQRDWLADLAACGIEARVVCPSSWAYIEDVLMGRK